MPAILAGLLIAAFCQAAPAAPPLEVLEPKSLEGLTGAFRQTSGWTGADGANSIAISPNRTLWIFADTFIGGVEKGRRVGARMVNNTFAWQALPADGQPLQFFWQEHDGKPAAVLQPDDAASWYWPGDGAMLGSRLYLLAKRVRKRAAGEPGFQFDWYGNDLLEIENPLDEPLEMALAADRTPFGRRFSATEFGLPGQ